MWHVTWLSWMDSHPAAAVVHPFTLETKGSMHLLMHCQVPVIMGMLPFKLLLVAFCISIPSPAVISSVDSSFFPATCVRRVRSSEGSRREGDDGKGSAGDGVIEQPLRTALVRIMHFGPLVYANSGLSLFCCQSFRTAAQHFHTACSYICCENTWLHADTQKILKRRHFEVES
jgi:hypothetical protein